MVGLKTVMVIFCFAETSIFRTRHENMLVFLQFSPRSFKFCTNFPLKLKKTKIGKMISRQIKPKSFHICDSWNMNYFYTTAQLLKDANKIWTQIPRSCSVPQILLSPPGISLASKLIDSVCTPCLWLVSATKIIAVLSPSYQR